MLEPRSSVGQREDLLFIGGTADFDLWWVKELGESPEKEEREHRLRVVRVASGSHAWDMFTLPLDTNPMTHSFQTGQQGYAGYFTDVMLTELEMHQVDAYLRCFAPWTLGEGLTDA